MIRTWRIDAGVQTIVLASRMDFLPQIVYWGYVLPLDEDLLTINNAARLDVTGGMLDDNPDLSICPSESQTFPGQSGMQILDENGKKLSPDFRFFSDIKQDNQLVLIFKDIDLGLHYEACFLSHLKTGMFEMKARIKSQKPVRLVYLSAPVLPAPQQSEELIDFSGRWCGEFQMNHIPWSAGIRYRQNPTGRTGHEHFPGLLVPVSGASNTRGEVYGLHYGWSGGHFMCAEELPDGRRQIQFGHAANTFKTARQNFETASLFATFSTNGINGCATSFQRHVRDNVRTSACKIRPRPVHYNCWEAVYFDHKLDELQQIADLAAELGAERFVLDDGWFAKRDDDMSSLGDWYIDKRTYPGGLGPLIDHVQKCGMSFGIWFEPEMINPCSELYNAHPEWVLGDRDQHKGRQQMALDITLPEVADYLYQSISDILSSYDVDYIKWDHNRVLPFSDAEQTYALYALLGRLNKAFPDVEIESCASGGGRADYGMLKYMSRIWLSDSNDAIERMKIQHNAALFLPASVTGSHVGPRQCHTSGRILPIELRAWIAAQRHMGFEMDPRELDEHEKTVLQEVTGWWKNNRHWMMRADILRLDHSDPAVIGEQQLAEDGTQFVVFAGRIDTSRQIAPRPLRLTGLAPRAKYLNRLVNKADAQRQKLSRGAPLLKQEDMIVSGSYLMSHGINLPWSFPMNMWVIEGRRLDD